MSMNHIHENCAAIAERARDLEARLEASEKDRDRFGELYRGNVILREEAEGKLEASERGAAAMREAVRAFLDAVELVNTSKNHQAICDLNAALASDAGRDFVPRAEGRAVNKSAQPETI